jgi:hypothetical protein
MAGTCKKRVKNANRHVLGKAREFPKRNAYIITLSNGNQGVVTNRLQNEVASGKSVQETTLYSDKAIIDIFRCATNTMYLYVPTAWNTPTHLLKHPCTSE